MKLYIDLETYSAAPLDAGVYRYAADPSFLILMAAWAVDDGPVEVAVTPEQIAAIPGLYDPDALKIAHNAQFERVCLSVFSGLGAGEFHDPTTYHDTMAVAGNRGLPQGLDNLALALGASPKDGAGSALIRYFCVPNRKGQRNLPESAPEKWLDFVDYCAQDVETLREVDQLLGDFPTEGERAVYRADQRINDRGILVDTELARLAEEAALENAREQLAELGRLTGCDNPNSRDQLLAWFRSTGLDLPDLRKETVSEALEGPLADDHRRALEYRRELALVASKKYSAALAGVSSDSRLRGQFRYFGAHTGRWTGRSVQLQNLPRLGFKTEREAEAEVVDIKLGFRPDATTLKKLVRPMFLGPLTVVDYSAIEARVIAWLAGEQWALDAFAEGRDIYVETARRMGEALGKEFTRSEGKVAVLALGYNGGVNSLRAMGAVGEDGQLKTLVTAWRRTNARIVKLWERLDDAFYSGGDLGLVRVEREGSRRSLVLPSGRALHYHDTKFKLDSLGRRRPSFLTPQGYRTDTYGGRLSENITQAVARDVLAEALVRLDRAGERVVGHVHDEVLVESDDLDRIQALMTESPSWAGGLPLNAAGFVCRRYRKD